MMHTFLAHNRAELIERCEAKVARRPARAATPEQLNGIPIFLDQLERTLRAERGRRKRQDLRRLGRRRELPVRDGRECHRAWS